MDNPAKGGRGKKAPYESTHYRLPVPLKPLAEELAANYRELVGDYADPEDPALIAAVLSAIAAPAVGIAPGETETKVKDYDPGEINRLKEEIRDLKQTRDSYENQKIQWYESLRENPVLKTQITELTEELKELRSATTDQTTEDSQQVKELLQDYEKMKSEMEELHQKVEKFKSVNQIISILSEALKLKANAGGAIKEKIKEALFLLV